MGITSRTWKILVLLAAFTATAAAGACAGERGTPGSRVGDTEWPRGDKLLLSLRVARAMKDGRGIARYKSLARQRRVRERRPSCGETAPLLPRHDATGRRPPAGR